MNTKVKKGDIPLPHFVNRVSTSSLSLALFDRTVNVFVLDTDVLTDLFIPNLVRIAMVTNERIELGIEFRVQRAAWYLVNLGHSFASCRHGGLNQEQRTVAHQPISVIIGGSAPQKGLTA